eukprot:TRINITY_DN1905_c0_g1_i1.p1 TRINITY_DN1905_c0_g1~~TRINITY_DN1905_c0_g1_i1.p1  ORF type:complete len:837 (-),score=194.46 TRINITY_DN1905_c0_g1_i1:49-2214(-)
MGASPGTLEKGGRCSQEGAFAGWCVAKGGTEYTAMVGECSAQTTGCGFMGGEFMGAGQCAPPESQSDTVYGTCSYSTTWGDSCMEMRGASWTDDSAKAKCDAPAMGASPGTLEKGGRCSQEGAFAGWCVAKGGTEYTAMVGECSAQTTGCGFMGGEFMGAGQCAPEDDKSDESNKAPDVGGVSGDGWCTLAPGAAGAAHMQAQSPGYSFDCAGAPSQQSPYMWPLMWSAHVESRGLKFGSDEIQYTSKGKVMYMLNKNWKRLDMYFQSGVQRTVGQAPCDEGSQEEGSVFGCNRNGARNSTILHRGAKMSFIDYHDNGSISSCSWMDLSFIGNVRPDWFMDDRGDATDVQYIGDSHVYYLGEPRLVKQWRKKDFANQYFTMSMQAIPGEEKVHWPLILNVPGEGFGDDFLQHYSHHETLSEDDSALFLIDDAFVEAGGSCPQRVSEGQGGPPTGQVEHIPSNLEVQKESWRTILWTGSPVWTPPKEEAKMGGGMEVTKEVSVTPCYDEATSMVRMSMKVKMDAMNWAAMAWRETEECLMTPRGGGNAELVFAKPESDGSYSMHFGDLMPSMKRFEGDWQTSFTGQLKALSGLDDFGAHSSEYQNGELSFMFTRKYATKPEKLYMNFAYGSAAEIGYHKSRGCFEVDSLPTCASVDAAGMKDCPTTEGKSTEAQGDTTAQTEAQGDTTSTPDTSSSGGRRLVEQATKGGAVMAAFSLGALLR